MSTIEHCWQESRRCSLVWIVSASSHNNTLFLDRNLCRLLSLARSVGVQHCWINKSALSSRHLPARFDEVHPVKTFRQWKCKATYTLQRSSDDPPDFLLHVPAADTLIFSKPIAALVKEQREAAPKTRSLAASYRARRRPPRTSSISRSFGMPISVAISESQLVIAPIDSDSRASLAAAAASGANEWACMIAQPQTQIDRAHTLLHLRKKFRALNLKRDPPDQPNVDECVDERLEKSEKNRRGIV